MYNAILLNNTMVKLKNLWLDRGTRSEYDEYCYQFKKIMDVLDENGLSIPRRLEDFLFDAGLPAGSNPLFYRNRITEQLKASSSAASKSSKRKRDDKIDSLSSNSNKYDSVEPNKIEKAEQVKKIRKVDFLDYHKSSCHASLETLKVKAERDHLEIENIRECMNCTRHKMMLDFLAKLPMPKSTAKRKLETLHCFLSPDLPQVGFTGSNSYLIILDNYSKMIFIYTLKSRNELPRILIKFLIHCFSRFGNKMIVKTLITPRLNELKFGEFSRFLKKNFIQHLPIESDDFVAYYARSVQVMIKLIMSDAEGIDESLWSEGIKAAVYVYNNLPNSQLNWKCPSDIWKDNLLVAPENYYPFGKWMMAEFKDPESLKPQIYRCRFVGYHPHNRYNYRFYNPREETIGFGTVSTEFIDSDTESTNHVK